MGTVVEIKHQTTSDKDATLPPLKEQMAFRRRFRNSSLEMLTVKQLRKKAERFNLDTTRLNHRWELIDLLERTQHSQILAKSAYRIYLNRVSFLDLPAEIRNQIYGYDLAAERGICSCSHYHRQSRAIFNCDHGETYREIWDKNTSEVANSGDACFTALTLWKQLNRAVRAESMSYYYSSNEFFVCEAEIWAKRWRVYNFFLDGIRDAGRASLRRLTIEEPIYATTTDMNYASLIHLLHQCKLEYLEICIHPVWLLKGPRSIWETAIGIVSQEDVDIPNFVKDFKPLVDLQRMHIRIEDYWKRHWTEHFFEEQEDFCIAVQEVLVKEELAREFKVALPKMHLTVQINSR